jgi:hypothetical protein
MSRHHGAKLNHPHRLHAPRRGLASPQASLTIVAGTSRAGVGIRKVTSPDVVYE